MSKIETRYKIEDLRLIIDSIFEEIIILDTSYNIVDVNKTFCEKYKVSKEDVIGKKCYKLTHGLNHICKPPECKCPLEDVIKTGKFSKSIHTHYKNGNEIFLELIAYPIKINEGKIELFVKIGRDITFRKKIEKSLRKSKRKCQEAYKRANFYKDLFTHDINNILQIINSSLELIALNLNGINFKSRIEELVNIAKEQVKRAAKLTFNVARISEIEDTGQYLTAIDVRDVLRTSIQYITNGFQNKRFQIEVLHLERPIYIKANEFLREVFDNILINAVLHNDHPIIEISVIFSKVRRDGNEYIKIEFLDNARGIPNEIKKDIFLRTEKTEKNGRGMGLGLSLVKKIVEKYNGYISIENKIKGDYTKGSKFTIIFEFAEPPNINGLINGLDLNISQ